MQGLLTHIKALNSEISLTPSQEAEIEPYLCSDPECVFPYGEPCEECRKAQIEKEAHRQKIVHANIHWVDEEALNAHPGQNATLRRNELQREAARQRWFEGGSWSEVLPSKVSVETFRYSTDGRDTQSSRGLERKDSVVHLRARTSSVSHTSLRRSGGDKVKPLLRKNESVHNLRSEASLSIASKSQLSLQSIQEYSSQGNHDLRSQPSLQSIQEYSLHGDLELKSQPSSEGIPETIIPLVKHHYPDEQSSTTSESTLTPVRYPFRPHEFPSRTITAISSSLSTHSTDTLDRSNLRMDNWLATLLSASEMVDPDPPLSLVNDTAYVDTSEQKLRVIVKASPNLVDIPRKQIEPVVESSADRRASVSSRTAASRTSSPGRSSSPSDPCPLCTNPIGDPRYQHLVKCKFAHDEKARLEDVLRRMKEHDDRRQAEGYKLYNS
jgi:hypothetical protein